MTGFQIPVLAALLLLANAAPAPGPEIDAKALVREAEDALRGETAVMKATMQITTPRWNRKMQFRSWDDRIGDRAFIRILAPKKDRGTGFLRVDETLWTYLPRVERTTRIPPSMMLQSWMGSDFTNDDLARESSLIDDYDAAFLGERDVGEPAVPAWGVTLTPHEDAPVVWAKIELWMAKEGYAPLLQLYYDEPEPGSFELVRRMRFSDIRTVQGRSMPHLWLMEPLGKPGHETRVVVDEIRLDDPIDAAVFSQRNLKRAEAVR